MMVAEAPTLPEPEIRTIIKEVYLEPKPLTKPELELHYRNELDAIRKAAMTQAYEQARAEKLEELEQLLIRVAEEVTSLRMDTEAYIQKYFDDLQYMAIEIAQRMIQQKISADDTVLQQLMLQAIHKLKNAKWIKVEISEELTTLLQRMQAELDKAEYGGRIGIYPIAASKDTCRISTEEGTTVLSIDRKSVV